MSISIQSVRPPLGLALACVPAAAGRRRRPITSRSQPEELPCPCRGSHACMVGRRTRGVGCGVPCVWAGRPGGRLGQWNTDRDPDMPAASWFMERGNGMLGACPVQAYVDCVHATSTCITCPLLLCRCAAVDYVPCQRNLTDSPFILYYQSACTWKKLDEINQLAHGRNWMN
jgi:hypothetical protein